MTRRFWWAAVLASACASAPDKDKDDDQPKEERPDAKTLAIKTTVRARTVTLVLARRWGDKMKLSAIHVAREENKMVAKGAATLRLLGLDVEAKESIEVRFIDDPGHEDVVLHAREVTLFTRHVEFSHSTIAFSCNTSPSVSFVGHRIFERAGSGISVANSL